MHYHILIRTLLIIVPVILAGCSESGGEALLNPDPADLVDDHGLEDAADSADDHGLEDAADSADDPGLEDAADSAGDPGLEDAADSADDPGLEDTVDAAGITDTSVAHDITETLAPDDSSDISQVPDGVDSGADTHEVVDVTMAETDTVEPDSGDSGTVVDCSELPPFPISWTASPGFGSGEDFDFDGEGMHGSVDGGNFILRTIDGERTLLAPGLSTETTGTRVLPSGDWVFADVGSGTLWRVEPSGSSTEVLSGLMYPNGVEVDRDGYVFVAENDAQRVRRIDPYTGEFTIVATGVLNANGLILSPDEQTLYIGTCYGSLWLENPIAIYGVDRLGEDEWAEPRAVLEAADQPCYDAINVDICGNIYVADYDTGWNARINRLSADGTQFDVIADVDSEWVPNMRWGNGIGGWETDVLYAADRFEGLLFALDMGIEGKPHLLAAD